MEQAGIFLKSRIVTCVLTSLIFVNNALSQSLLDYVDTRVGSAYAETKTAGKFGKGSEEHGQTVPAVGVPHGMNMWTPQTRDTEKKCVAPYYYADELFGGFRNSHWVNGGCTQDYGSVTLSGLYGDLRTSPERRGTRMDKDSEVARPDYYSVRLPDEGMQAEVTGLSRGGMFRFTYTQAGTGHIVVYPNSDEGEATVEYDPAKREIRASNPVHRIYQGWGERAGFSGYYVARLPENLEITEWGTFRGDTINKGKQSISAMPRIGVYVSYKVKKGDKVTVKAGSSFTGMDAAVRNMEGELGDSDFEGIRSRSAAEWQERLGKIRTEGGDFDANAKLYGALYRASLLPRVYNDLDGAYPSFATGTPIRYMEPGHDYYDDFSMWDTYRALHPLLNIIDPHRSGDMMQSLVLKAEQGGWMPIFPCWNSYTAAMIGDHCAVVLADAAVKGIKGFDIDSAYKYLRKNAFDSPGSFDDYKNGMGRRALKSYLKHGYIPVEDPVAEAFHDDEQSSRTLEYAFDDYALAQIAKKLGNQKDYKKLMRRSQNWRNVMDRKSGYANGRHANGKFVAGTDPFTFNDAFTEGAPCHYTWYVPHDVPGLIDLMGGNEKFTAKLDSMFSQGRYWHGNEPCHQIPYMFDAAGRWDLTQKYVRHIMDTEYMATPGGLSGNDDAGQMSAWYVFSALGFYPVAPSTPYYYIGVPAFKSITLDAGGKLLNIRRKGADGGVCNKVTYNGKPLNDFRLSHDRLINGGTLLFE